MLKRKKWGDMSKKEKAVGIVALFFFVIIVLSVFSPSGDENKDQSEGQTQTETEQSVETEPQTDEERIRSLTSSPLQGQNNMDKNYIRKMEVSGDSENGYDVDLEFNADDNLSANLRKGGLESKMSRVYMALFTSDNNINQVTVSAYFPLIDEYGNESDGLVYQSTLDKSEAEKVNWQANESMLKLTILPQVWETVILHPEFR